MRKGQRPDRRGHLGDALLPAACCTRTRDTHSLQVLIRIEDAAAWNAVVVRLTRVLVQAEVAQEDRRALRTLVVILVKVLLQIRGPEKVGVAKSAEGVRG